MSVWRALLAKIVDGIIAENAFASSYLRVEVGVERARARSLDTLVAVPLGPLWALLAHARNVVEVDVALALVDCGIEEGVLLADGWSLDALIAVVGGAGRALLAHPRYVVEVLDTGTGGTIPGGKRRACWCRLADTVEWEALRTVLNTVGTIEVGIARTRAARTLNEEIADGEVALHIREAVDVKKQARVDSHGKVRSILRAELEAGQAVQRIAERGNTIVGERLADLAEDCCAFEHAVSRGNAKGVGVIDQVADVEVIRVGSAVYARCEGGALRIRCDV